MGNNAPGKCLQAHMQHFFSPSPGIEKKYAESAFFHTKIKNLSWNRWIYEPNGAKQQKLLLGNNAPGKCFPSQMHHFFSPRPAKEEKFAESAFFHTKIINLSWNHWIYEPNGAKHQKLLLGNNAPGKCLQAHMQHFFSPSPGIEKKFAESAFFSYKNQKLVMKPLNLRANRGIRLNVPPFPFFSWPHIWANGGLIARDFMLDSSVTGVGW